MADKSFGILYAVDFYGCDPFKLDSIDVCYELLDKLPDVLKMTKQCPPYVFRTPKDTHLENCEGNSGWVGLVQSGIQFHSMPSKGFLSLDVYTCSSLVIADVVGFVKQLFGYTHYKGTLLERGIEYHTN